ncbi:MAG TPA: glutamate synthase (NADPH), homotetrameric [Clostridiales bacterium]|nr:MAG: glutamate synthase (NADPH), homotetrameric [Clostridiales bacterium GWD2_32_59]HAN10735.1 glutamate synthase (NADPH), homotetrameric [Clostridiales bacterium]
MQDLNKRVKAREQNIDARLTNFDEVVHGFTKEEAMLEANRCLKCKTRPCVTGCPVSNDIPEFISSIAEGKMEEAYEIVKKRNNFPAICGRVCPQEDQCEGNCVRAKKGEPLAIGLLERFCSDYSLENMKIEKEIKRNNIKVAVIGSGPAGLACARDLVEEGYRVTVYEALDTIGGILIYGIPKFRLQREVVDREIEYMKKQGVEFVKNKRLGVNITIDELYKNEFKAIFIGTGANKPKKLEIEGEDLKGIYSAYEYLLKVNLHGKNHGLEVGKKVVVIGGGNVAMDAARVLKRLGAEDVTIIYRKTREQMPARNNEINHAKEENIEIMELISPVRFIGKEGKLEKIEVLKMEPLAPDESGKMKSKCIEGSNFFIDAETTIIAIGQDHDNPLTTKDTENISTHTGGGILVHNETMETSKENIFAGGDVVSGGSTVIEAIKAGKKAAKAINEKLKNNKI